MYKRQILSQVPYVVFKHPKHHVEEMKKELGDKDGFVFCHARQKIIRQIDSVENIQKAFESIQ